MIKNANLSQLKMYRVEKPDFSKIDREKIIEKLAHKSADYRDFFEKANEPRYLYWDELKYKSAPEGLTSEEFWFIVRQFRALASKSTPIKAESGKYFSWMRLSSTDEFLHKIDISSGGQIFTSLDVIAGQNKQKYISRGILEESIASSQLEGAHTTRAAAKKMILEKRTPQTPSEKMILNNYTTMMRLEEHYKNQELSEDLLFELHKSITEGAVPPQTQGRFRRNSDDIVVQGPLGGKEYITHIPPEENFVVQEIPQLIKYANSTGESFIHPIIKAIFIHFWIGYLHPFTDGNGRLARTLFYWYLLRQGYWTFMYLPISTVIKRAPAQYAKAYLYSEQDELDVTYFYDFHIRKVIQSMEEFNQYITTKIVENKEVDSMLDRQYRLNDRQKQLMHYVSSTTDAKATTSSHAIMNSISRQTAAKDLKALENAGLLVSEKQGRYLHYRASPNLSKLSPARHSKET